MRRSESASDCGNLPPLPDTLHEIERKSNANSDMIYKINKISTLNYQLSTLNPIRHLSPERGVSYPAQGNALGNSQQKKEEAL